MEYKFRLAEAEDYELVNVLFRKAIQDMIAKNIFQWDEIYPNGDILLSDIEKRQMYVLTQNAAILSAVVLNEEQDKQYETVCWNYKQGRIAIIHRLCVNPDYQNKGIGRQTILFAETLLREKGYNTIRLDAFSQNPYALKLYAKLDYSMVGEALFRKGKFYLFEKSITHKKI